MARHAKVLQLLRDDKGICNASFRIIAQFYNAIRLRYMRIVFVFDFAQNFLLREFNYGILNKSLRVPCLCKQGQR